MGKRFCKEKKQARAGLVCIPNAVPLKELVTGIRKERTKTHRNLAFRMYWVPIIPAFTDSAHLCDTAVIIPILQVGNETNYNDQYNDHNDDSS